MFERYTEKARRTIFFARYEASQYGSSQIEPEHLLLALIREYPFLRRYAPPEKVREQIDAALLRKPGTSTSLDLPLSQEGKRILAYGAEEAERLGSHWIDCQHLTLGLLRIQDCLAADLLRQHGVTSEAPEAAAAPREVETEPVPEAVAPATGPLAQRLALTVAACQDRLEAINETDAVRKLKRRDWTRKQALGHLIDLATAHHQWFARALVEPRVTAVSYPAPDWATAQKYHLLPWYQLVDVWQELQSLLIHVLSSAPEDRWKIPCRIGLDPAMPLSELADSYAQRVEEVLAEISTRA